MGRKNEPTPKCHCGRDLPCGAHTGHEGVELDDYRHVDDRKLDNNKEN